MAFGWGVKDGSEELQTCTVATGCEEGLSGGGPGEFGKVPFTSQLVGPTGIAVDSGGDVYVMDLGNYRVQKFDSEGKFLATFGGKVNGTTSGNVCTAASGDTCVAGQPGTGPGEFSIENVLDVRGDYLDIGPDGTVYVADKDRIQAFNPDGSFKSAIPLPEPGNPGALAVDPKTGNLYFAFKQEGPFSAQPGVYRLNQNDGKQIGAVLPVGKPFGLATDPNGDVYVISKPGDEDFRAVEFDATGNEVGELGRLGRWNSVPTAIATGVVGPDVGDVDVYASESSSEAPEIARINAFGATPDPTIVGLPPKRAPRITEQFAASVDSDGAVLRAAINPQFWNDTSYYVEYGAAPCSLGSCTSVPLPPGSRLPTKVTNSPVISSGVFLGGLVPSTTYHYRFVAQSGGSGGQPVRGLGGAVGVDGDEATFTTAAVPVPSVPCPNDVFRTGAGASLPDCRAYEMVSPVDKSNADIATLVTFGELPGRVDQSSADGEKLTYSAYKAFGDAVASPFSSQYLVVRDPAAGWVGHSISPPRQGPTLLPSAAIEPQFKTFSSDLCSGWFMQDTALSLAPEAVAGFANLYRADLCAGGYEAITRVAPPARSPDHYLSEIQGQANGHTLLRANDKLTPNAPAGEAPKVYDYFEESLNPVCVLPNKAAVSSGCAAGMDPGGSPSSNIATASVRHAISSDGSRIFWTAAGAGPGKLYMRSDAATTIAISKGVAEFLGAAADGSRAIYREGKTLFEFKVETDAPEAGTPIAGALIGLTGGVLGMSEDASRVYFVSEEDLDGGGPAAANKPNLYVHDEAGTTFIATLSDLDIKGSLSDTSSEPYQHTARVSPDGGTVAFLSNNELTGQDSKDVNSGEADSQVYIWHAGDGVLRCVSCNRTGARPVGADVSERLSQFKSSFWAAGLLPTTENRLYAPRALSDDGERLFFESTDALVPDDTNGALDVYEWEANGKGSCQEAGGCVQLISSGKSPQSSEFVDADPSGSNVFFTTNSSLVAQDSGLIDIYDARVVGGFAPPPPQPAICEGEACQGAYSPLTDPTPASAAFEGAGNVKAAAPTVCRKGTVRLGSSCVVKKQKSVSRHKRTAKKKSVTRHKQALKKQKSAARHKRAARHNQGGAK
jgi:NHL repeat